MKLGYTDTPELLAPAGSPEAVIAAVEAGADAVYMAGTEFNARRNAKNLSEQELARAIAYCKIRGVKTHITVNILLSDRELPAMLSYGEKLCRMGADALIVADLGGAFLLKKTLPDLSLHASTQMTIHNTEGVAMAEKMGFDRVVLSRELSLSDIQEICRNAKAEIEVFAHGALCMCYSGQCYLSSLIGRRSGNRGLCAQPCRLPYLVNGSTAGNGYPLSLKDLNLSDELSALSKAGVRSLKIEGRMKPPGYVAAVIGVYAKCLGENRRPTPEESQELSNAFSRDGFTRGYFENNRGAHMFGVRAENAPRAMENPLRRGHEPARIPVVLTLFARLGESLTLTASDGTHTVCANSGPLEKADKPVQEERIRDALCRTGGTPYRAEAIIDRDPEAFIPVSEVNILRRRVLEELDGKRSFVPEPTVLPAPGKWPGHQAKKTRFTVRVEHLSQVTSGVRALEPARIDLPLELFEKEREAVFALCKELCIFAVVPTVARTDEMPEIYRLCNGAKDMGAAGFCVSNLGSIPPASETGLPVFGDTGMNVFNSYTAGVLSELGLAGCTLSFELSLPALRELESPIPTEAVVYGRLPAMLCENCVLKNAGFCGTCGKANLTDRTGEEFPVLRAFGCRSRIVNAHVLWLCDRQKDFSSVDYKRLDFTVETPAECDRVCACYRNGGGDAPEKFTRGLYYRSIE